MSTPVPHGAPADPYRIFFPLGVLLGIAGVAIWPAYHLGFTGGYSGRAHAFVQAEGFLYAFIAGFLLTAIPRFTGTAAPRRAAPCNSSWPRSWSRPRPPSSCSRSWWDTWPSRRRTAS